jgi:hypothetical protein
MAKVTWGEFKKDDPIFSEGLQSFVPTSRPLMASSAKSMTGVAPAQSPSATSQEADEQLSLMAKTDQALRLRPESSLSKLLPPFA